MSETNLPSQKELSRDLAESVCAKEDLDGLLQEVTSLATRLRQVAGDSQTPSGLPVAGKMVLEVLTRYGAKTVPQIARIRNTSRQNIQVLVNKLEKDSHVTLLENPAHKRSPFVQLTENGKTALGHMLRTEEKGRQNLLVQLKKADVVSSSELLNRIRRLLNEIEATPMPQPSMGGDESGEGAKTQYGWRRSRTKPFYRPKVDETPVYNDLPVNLL